MVQGLKITIEVVIISNYLPLNYKLKRYLKIYIWAALWQNQQSGMFAQRRLAWASTQSDQSSLCAQWVAKDPSFPHVDSEDSDQTGRMSRLIWVFAGRTCHLLVLSWGGSFVNQNVGTLYLRLCLYDGTLSLVTRWTSCSSTYQNTWWKEWGSLNFTNNL